MPNEEPLELDAERGKKAISSEAAGWGAFFVLFLESQYAVLASKLPSNATLSDYKQAMSTALRAVWQDLGDPQKNDAGPTGGLVGQPFGAEADTLWTTEKNARRLELIDKAIQQEIVPDESIELDRLTAQLRATYDREAETPMEGARQLHRRLLDKPAADV